MSNRPPYTYALVRLACCQELGVDDRARPPELHSPGPSAERAYDAVRQRGWVGGARVAGVIAPEGLRQVVNVISTRVIQGKRSYPARAEGCHSSASEQFSSLGGSVPEVVAACSSFNPMWVCVGYHPASV